MNKQSFGRAALAMLLGSVIFLVMGAGAATAAKTITLKAHTFIGMKAPTVAVLMGPWAKKVEKESKGQLKINIYPSMQLGGKPPQLIDQVLDGVVDIVWTLPGYTAGRFVESEVFELPFVHSNTVATNMALQDFADKHPNDFKGLKVILLHVHAGAAFHSYDPISKVSDVKGMKIRTPSRTGGWLLEAMGAVPIGAPVPKVPELLSKRVVDAVMLPYEITLVLKTHEMVDNHMTLDDPMYNRPNTSRFLFAMNQKKYDSLPANLRKVIDNNSGRHIAKDIGLGWMGAENKGEEAAKASGKLHKMAPSEVAILKGKVAQEVYDRWSAEVKKKGIDGPALIKEAKALVAKYTN